MAWIEVHAGAFSPTPGPVTAPDYSCGSWITSPHPAQFYLERGKEYTIHVPDGKRATRLDLRVIGYRKESWMENVLNPQVNGGAEENSQYTYASVSKSHSRACVAGDYEFRFTPRHNITVRLDDTQGNAMFVATRVLLEVEDALARRHSTSSTTSSTTSPPTPTPPPPHPPPPPSTPSPSSTSSTTTRTSSTISTQPPTWSPPTPSSSEPPIPSTPSSVERSSSTPQLPPTVTVTVTPPNGQPSQPGPVDPSSSTIGTEPPGDSAFPSRNLSRVGTLSLLFLGGLAVLASF